jgi:hypothetical protein
MTAIRGIEHEARLPVLDHVGELRVRLMIALAAFTVAFGFAFWQNHAVLSLLIRPLAHTSAHAAGPLAQTAHTEQSLRTALLRQRIAFAALARNQDTPRTTEQAFTAAARADAAAVASIPTTPARSKLQAVKTRVVLQHDAALVSGLLLVVVGMNVSFARAYTAPRTIPDDASRCSMSRGNP